MNLYQCSYLMITTPPQKKNNNKKQKKKTTKINNPLPKKNQKTPPPNNNKNNKPPHKTHFMYTNNNKLGNVLNKTKPGSSGYIEIKPSVQITCFSRFSASFFSLASSSSFSFRSLSAHSSFIFLCNEIKTFKNINFTLYLNEEAEKVNN